MLETYIKGCANFCIQDSTHCSYVKNCSIKMGVILLHHACFVPRGKGQLKMAKVYGDTVQFRLNPW